ncbi:hypothetical protein AGOR_G00103240 [Albula goreensis]|uniref:Syndecan n=1 Tax=Albula goreensis TaxID=1534307 RepID=A0A8T3DGE7_9TELE|nr:hypothetical protein AGOR_G00103240 [Albula goreensis]
MCGPYCTARRDNTTTLSPRGRYYCYEGKRTHKSLTSFRKTLNETRMQVTVLLLVCLGPWIHTAQSGPVEEFESSTAYPEDQDVSGDDLELSGSGSGSGDFGVKATDFSSMWNVSTAPPPVKPAMTTEQDGGVVEAKEEEGTVSQAAAATPTTATPTMAPPAATASNQLTTAPGRVIEEVPEVPLLQTTSSPAATQAKATPPPVKATAAPVANEPVPSETTQSLLATESSPTEAAAPVGVDTEPESEMLPATTPAAEIDTESIDPTQDDMSSGDSDNAEATASPTLTESDIINPNVVERVDAPIEKTVRTGMERNPDDSDMEFEPVVNQVDTEKAVGETSENQSLLERKEVLGGVIAGGVVGLAFAIMLVSLMVYRMKKKDEGSYALDEQKHPNGYQKPQRQEEFLA